MGDVPAHQAFRKPGAAHMMDTMARRLAPQLEVLSGVTQPQKIDGRVVGSWVTQETLDWTQSDLGKRTFRWATKTHGVTAGRWEVWSRDPSMRGAEMVGSGAAPFQPGDLLPGVPRGAFTLNLHDIVLARQSITGAPVWRPDRLFVRVVPVNAAGTAVGPSSNLVTLHQGSVALPEYKYSGVNGRTVPTVQWLSYTQYKPAFLDAKVIRILRDHPIPQPVGPLGDPVGFHIWSLKYAKAGDVVHPGSRYILWDKAGSSGAVSDLGEALSAIGGAIGLDSLAAFVDWLSEQYAMLKQKMVELAADIISVTGIDCPPEWLAAGLDLGLVALGIPPQLPDFEELADMGVDVLAEEIAAKTGVPMHEAVELARQAVPRVAQEARTAHASPLPGDGDWWVSINCSRPAVLRLLVSHPGGSAGNVDTFFVSGPLFYGYLKIPQLQVGESVEVPLFLYPSATEVAWYRDVFIPATSNVLTVQVVGDQVNLATLDLPVKSGLDAFGEPLVVDNPAAHG